ncbi:MAG: 30S ribosomal protein S6 [Phycisphaerales bacterium]
METAVKNRLYEGMFLIDSALASTDWDGTLATIRTILEKAEAEIVSIRKWDERKLAYEIKGKSRGTYILCYFKADGDRIQGIEKAVTLSEQIMRVLILNAERLTPEDIEKDTPATKVEKEKQKASKPAAVKAEEEQLSTKAAETEAAEKSEQTDETQQAQEKETKDSPAPGANTAADESAEKQQEQVETPEEADKQE